MVVETDPAPAYAATKEQIHNRLRRIEGQVRGLQRMVDEDRHCIDVITQISAVQAALDKVALGLLGGHARHSLASGDADNDCGDAVEDLMAAVARLTRIG